MASEMNSTIREELTPVLLKLFPKIAEEETLLNSLYMPSISSTPKSEKDITHTKENYRSISLMNIGAKTNKILANRSQQYIRSIVHHDQVGLS